MRKQNVPVAKLIFGLFEEFTNINHSCPFVVIKDLYLKPELLRLPLPTGDYMLALRWFFEKRQVSDTNFSFVFIEDLMKSK
ncbi:GL21490 [Drosophila persimilis]|uniref:GL21490 n=1 Tax=Drosophila persimilis TaxID=7234 RepID=B4GDT8_DROPE|nr:GL21490 [Drosophila persimilis]